MSTGDGIGGVSDLEDNGVSTSWRLVAEVGSSRFDSVFCFLLKSSNHFIKGQYFQVGSETPGAPLEQRISNVFLVALNVSLRLVHAFAASSPIVYGRKVVIYVRKKELLPLFFHIPVHCPHSFGNSEAISFAMSSQLFLFIVRVSL